MLSPVLMESFNAAVAQDFSRLDLPTFMRRYRPRRTLFASAGDGLVTDGEALRDSWLVTLGEASPNGHLTTHGEVTDLPFQDEVFDLVIAQNLLSDGSEKALPELHRVLAGGGRLLVLGSGHWSRRYRFDGEQEVPLAVRPWRLCRALRDRSFEVEDCVGIGVLGSNLRARYRWNRPLVTLSDRVVISARRHETRPNVRILKFANPRTATNQGAALDALNRESAV